MPSRARIISSQPGPWSFPPAVMTLKAPAVDTEAAGWDVMREELLVPYTPYFAAGERRDHVLLPNLPNAIMVVQNERTIGHKGGYPVIELTSWGLARAKPWKATTSGDSQGTTGSSTGLTRDLPTVNVYWFSATLEGTKIYVPWPAVPPETFGWQALGGTKEETNNRGWFLTRRDVEPLPIICGATAGPWKDGALGGNTRPDANAAPQPTLCMVSDFYVYDYATNVPPAD